MAGTCSEAGGRRLESRPGRRTSSVKVRGPGGLCAPLSGWLGRARGVESFRRKAAISDAASIAGLISILVSLWLGLALLMGIRGGKGLPASSGPGARVVFGTLTFLLWYAGMLLAMSFLAMLAGGRSAREVGWTALGLLAGTAVLWGLRRLSRQALCQLEAAVPAHSGATRS